ncbi:hypothetical protein N9N28_15995 [Rubripirellula amarantea]|uniref:Uncharacterized protein n=1 Tax=Rubripirellula amarantea TaxID=2527999 RepID=A0A5C5WSA0_9BACT|nr:hypothetical protein [Rubripirellula amarantea]MDA8746127.1 hypothetical protein [Rubripirellula amarantea]TWT53487.1 hypothetical protein Pla22_11160 [Rubripirellula amarantea]
MSFKSICFNTYLFFGLAVCIWFTFAAAYGWKAPDLGIVNNSSSGRSYGGSYGGGK